MHTVSLTGDSHGPGIPDRQSLPARATTRPVNTEADAGSPAHHRRDAARDLLGTLYHHNGPNPQFAPRRLIPLVRRRRHDPRLPHRERQRLATGTAGCARPSGRSRTRRAKACPAPSAIRATPIRASLRSTRPIANTNIVWHAGQACSRSRRRTRPSRSDPADPRRRSRATRPAATSSIGPFTAHPKRDPSHGRAVLLRLFGQGPLQSRRVSLQTLEQPNGAVTRAEILEGPFPSMIHDFAHDQELDRAADLPAYLLDGARNVGQAAARLREPDKGTHIAFIPRQRHGGRREVGERARLLRLPSDEITARRRTEKVVVDVMKYDMAPLFPQARRLALVGQRCRALRLFRWTFDLSTATANTFKRGAARRPLPARSRVSTSAFAWPTIATAGSSPGNIVDPQGRPRRASDGLIALRPQDREEQRASAPRADDRFGEPIFVPRDSERTRPRATAGS